MTKFPAFGKTIRLRLVPPIRRLVITTSGLSALGVTLIVLSFFLLGWSPRIVGIWCLLLAAYFGATAVRLRRWNQFEIVVGGSTITVPIEPLVRRRALELPMEQIDKVSYGVHAAGAFAIAIDVKNARHLIPFAWVPVGWDARELAYRMLVRIEMKKLGVPQESLAAIEAGEAPAEELPEAAKKALGDPEGAIARAKSWRG